MLVADRARCTPPPRASRPDPLQFPHRVQSANPIGRAACRMGSSCIPTLSVAGQSRSPALFVNLHEPATCGNPTNRLRSAIRHIHRGAPPHSSARERSACPKPQPTARAPATTRPSSQSPTPAPRACATTGSGSAARPTTPIWASPQSAPGPSARHRNPSPYSERLPRIAASRSSIGPALLR